jgi:hypothetical protein
VEGEEKESQKALRLKATASAQAAINKMLEGRKHSQH